MKALVVGGGIGGLAAGIALRRAGLEVELSERARAIREVGAGLSLWPNALHVLDELGAGARVRALGVAQSDGLLQTSRGRPLIEISMAEIEEACGAPVVMLHRAALVEALLAEFGQPAPILGRELTDVSERDRRVTASFSDGSHAEGDLLIGADGWRSAVRTRLFPGARTPYVGYTVLRAVVDVRVERTSESWGPGARFGLVPLADGRLYWFAVWNAKEGEALAPLERRERALSTFGGWHAPIEDVIRATDPAAILHDDVREVVGLPAWSLGRIALLGDAAHAMTPNLGQGGCMGLEDAFVLARCLTHGKPVEDALDLYVRLRRPRVERVARDSRAFGYFGQLANPLSCRIRDALTVATKGRYGRGVVLQHARARPKDLLG